MKESTIYDCTIVELDKHHSDKGNLTVVENGITVPFDVKRTYYLYDIPGGESRGAHAHKRLKQLIVAASGSFSVTLDDGKVKRTFLLNRPYQGLLVVPGIWRDLYDFSSGAVCLVLASEPYEASDYIRDYGDFLDYKGCSEIKRYTASDRQRWNEFVKGAKNSTFLFDRDYMDYHSDRFEDHSLMVYRKGALYALLPANISGNQVYSHQGLTYGGLIMSKKACAAEILEVFRLINAQLKSEDVKSVIYKPTPYIYHSIPSQEDLYALFRLTDARIIGRNISSTIYQGNKIKFVESRKSGIRKAKNHCLKIRQSDDFSRFWEILSENLMTNHNARPVHSIEEMTLLANRFPDKIKLYLVESESSGILGGTVIYEANDQVIHTQYISASPEGKELGALDLLFDYLINEVYTDHPIFDFGQSTEEMGKVLNDKLIFQKEGFGGRGVIYDTYEYSI